MGSIPCCIVCPNPYKSVQQGNVGLVSRFGKFYKAVDPGLVKINPLSERLLQVDVKIQIAGKKFQPSQMNSELMRQYRGSPTDVHDQGQRDSTSYIRHLLPHQLTAQGRFRHLKRTASTNGAYSDHSAPCCRCP